MTRTTILAAILTVGAAANPCGLACWLVQGDQARDAGDVRAEQTALVNALKDAESGGPRVMVAVVSNRLAMAYANQYRYAEAEEAYGRSVKVLDNGLRASAPELARTLTNLGALCYQQGRFAAAVTTLDRAVKIWEGLGGTAEPDYASALDDLGAALRSQARYAEAETLYKRALGIREKQGSSGERQLATVLHNLAALELDMGRYGEAEQHERRALEIRRGVAGVKPSDVQESLNVLGLIAEARNAISDAVTLFRQALDVQSDPLATSRTLINLGGAYRELGEAPSARASFERASQLIRETQPRHPLLADAFNVLGLLAHESGHDAQARELFESALAIWRETLGPDHPDYASGLCNLALCYPRQKAKARELYQRALNIDEAKLGPLHPHVERDLGNLGAVAFAMHDDVAAEDYLRRSLEVHARRGAPDSADEAITMATLAAVYAREQKPSAATDAYRRALAILGSTAHPDDPRVAGVLDAYAALMRGCGSFAEAEGAAVRANGIRVRNALREE